VIPRTEIFLADLAAVVRRCFSAGDSGRFEYVLRPRTSL